WDERIAQITSEYIEREDELMASAGLGGGSDIEDTVCSEGLQALSDEVNELLSSLAETRISQPQEAGPAEQTDRESETPACSAYVPGECIAKLREHVERLTGGQGSLADGFVGLSAERRSQARRDLSLVKFYASSSEATLSAVENDGAPEIVETLTPIGHALRDAASAMCEGTERRMTVEFAGEDNQIDVRLLKPVGRILRHLIADIFLRCEEPDLRVDVTAVDAEGALRFTLSDNGDNFIHDSRLDPDEYLAFYPGLRKARTILHQFRSLLWVEPHENRSTRFAFTTPRSIGEGTFNVLRNDGQSVAVLPCQLSAILDASDAQIGNDSRGEHLVIDGRRVPVLRLGQIYSGAPTDGDRVAVVGFLEKRVAFYFDGEARLEDGTWRKEAAAAWRGMQDGIVEVGGDRIPLVEANSLLKRYLTIVEESLGGDASGGIGDDDLAASSAGVERGSARGSIGRRPQGEVETDVLVLEQSETLRSAIASILSERQIRAKCVDRLEAALDFMSRGRAALIISDFRVPSMAAKVLAERLRSNGEDIPVLVTTSHSDESAEILVERLGVAGYISKPFRPEDVLTRVNEFLGSPHAPASRT
ncbi:MAG: response regulator, partial [bacterium]